jgi:2-oxoisovalerate dehydrogenase E2 component (dihydrolipoyl transacylase)
MSLSNLELLTLAVCGPDPFFLCRNVSPRSSIGAFEPLCEVQSDKASMEITSPYEGTVKEILVQEGQVAKVGEGLCIIEVEEGASDSSDDLTSESPNASATAGPPPPQERESVASGGQPSVSESQPASDKPPVARRSHPLDPNNTPAPESTTLSSSQLATNLKVDATDVLALPAVRHFARKRGVDVALLSPGSGKNGRVEREDIERYLAIGRSVGEQQQPVATTPPLAEENVVVELGRTRYGMWKAMEKACTSVDLSDVVSYHSVLRPPSRVWKSRILGRCLSLLPLSVRIADEHLAIQPHWI